MTTLEEAFKEIRNENSKYSIQVLELKQEIETLKNELWQQRFNNKHNLSIDQKVSDELANLKAEVLKERLRADINYNEVLRLRRENNNQEKTIFEQNESLSYFFKNGTSHKFSLSRASCDPIDIKENTKYKIIPDSNNPSIFNSYNYLLEVKNLQELLEFLSDYKNDYIIEMSDDKEITGKILIYDDYVE